MHVDDAVLDKEGRIDPNKIKLVGRLGGDYYVDAFGTGLFNLKKPD
jgi:hypothetical protein